MGRRFALGMLSVMIAIITMWPRPAEAVPIRVRGAAALRAHMRFDDEGWLELHGQLGDETRLPIDQGRVVVDGRGELLASEASPCEDVRVPLSRGGGPDRIAVRTSQLGEFCLRWRRAPARGRARLHFAGDSYHGATELEVSYDRGAPQKLRTSLRFEPRPQALDIDREEALIGGLLTVLPATAHATRRGLSVILARHAEGEEHELMRARTSGDGKVRFVVRSDQLGPPGHGSLSVRFEGTAQLAAASDAQAVTLRASVPLRLAAPVPAALPGESAVASVLLEPAAGVVHDGVVEALVRGRSVGSAPVRCGAAELEIAIEDTAVEATSVTIRYLPASPWWRAGPPLTATVPVRAPSAWGHAAWSALLLVVALWTLQSWRRARRRQQPKLPAEPTTPGVHLIQTIEVDAAWRGVVSDAHDGTALAGARIVVQVPTLQEGADDARRVVECRSDGSGRFSFELDDRPNAATLCVSLASHSSERRPLPAPGVLQVNLLTRRRNVLRRFVGWARSRGNPFFAPPEPTPGHVKHVAEVAAQGSVAQWASAVEAVAFGAHEVDQAAERRLRASEPAAAPRPGTATRRESEEGSAAITDE